MLDFDSYFSVDRTDRGDNLALFLRTTFNCQIVNFSNNHGNVDIVDTTSVCGNLPATRVTLMGHRRAAWDFLLRLYSQINAPWCIFGDFNDILDANWLINGFRQAVLDFGLSDVPVDGYPFTYLKSLGTPHAVEERLDIA